MYYTNIPESDLLQKQRLNFRLPDFTRIIWASGETRKYWPQLIQQASNDWQEIEKLSFQEGIKDSILIYVYKDEIYELKKWAKRVGGSVVILNPTPMSNSYSSFGVQNGPSNGFRVAVTREKFVGDWYDAWNGETDNKTIGALLGYPTCCTNFFEKYWVEEQWRDLTYPAYMNTINEDNELDEIDPKYNVKYGSAQGPIEANILGRWVGIRWVSHMPCSFKCEHSVEIGKQNREVAKQFGYKKSANIIDEVLGWSTRWSALHGILEIKTPVFKVSAATEATSEELIIEREGTHPEKSASGLGFPFKNKRTRPYTDSNRFKKSLDAVSDTDLWEDNGFSSKDAMRKSHEPILNMIGDDKLDSIIDLGSGNGVLLEQLRMATNASCTAVEINSDVVDRGRNHFNKIKFYNDDIFNFEYDSKYDMTIFMVGRLTEVNREQREKIIEQIVNNSKFVLLYMYGDWVDKYNNVDELLKSFMTGKNLLMLDEHKDSNISLAKYQIL